jgi:hypothetical protein
MVEGQFFMFGARTRLPGKWVRRVSSGGLLVRWYYGVVLAFKGTNK